MMNLLIVDDNQELREILVSMLEIWAEDQGFDMQIIEKENGLEALEWIKANRAPDYILLDVRMPVMGGAKFLRQSALLGMDLRPRTLLLTGYADDLEEHLGNDALLMKHLRKPFVVEELFEALDNLTNKASD